MLTLTASLLPFLIPAHASAGPGHSHGHCGAGLKHCHVGSPPQCLRLHTLTGPLTHTLNSLTHSTHSLTCSDEGESPAAAVIQAATNTEASQDEFDGAFALCGGDNLGNLLALLPPSLLSTHTHTHTLSLH